MKGLQVLIKNELNDSEAFSSNDFKELKHDNRVGKCKATCFEFNEKRKSP